MDIQKKQLIARSILTVVLLYFIFGETGPITTFSFFLLFIASELQTYINDNILKRQGIFIRAAEITAWGDK